MLDYGSQGAGARANTPTLDRFTSSIGDRANGFACALSWARGAVRPGSRERSNMMGIRIRRGTAVLAALVMGICASAESARAALAGHPSYSANLSVNAALRKQQLICDPAG